MELLPLVGLGGIIPPTIDAPLIFTELLPIRSGVSGLVVGVESVKDFTELRPLLVALDSRDESVTDLRA